MYMSDIIKIKEMEFKKFLSHQEIVRITKNIADQINHDYAGQKVTLVGLLKGCLPFYCELIKHIKVEMTMDFLTISSYHGKIKASNELKLNMDLNAEINNKNILIVDDIVDKGKVMSFLNTFLKMKNPRSIKTCVLLDKQVKERPAFKMDYVGIEIPDIFVLGFGLDYMEKCRQLPDLYY